MPSMTGGEMLVRSLQQEGVRVFCGSELHDSDFAKLTEVIGACGAKPKGLGKTEPVVGRALTRTRPAVIEISAERRPSPWPRKPLL